jgi:proteasome accessory factor B
LIRLLAEPGPGYTQAELADRFKVETRTIQRDLALWEELGARFRRAIRSGTEAHRIRVPAKTAVVPLGLSWDEALVTWLSLQQVAAQRGPNAELARLAADKLADSFQPMVRGFLKSARTSFRSVAAVLAPVDDDGEIYSVLTEAIHRHQAVRLVYRSQTSAEAAPRELLPLGLVEHRRNGAVYLIAIAPDHDDEIRKYKLTRASDIELLERSFKPPKDFRLEDHAGGSFGIYGGPGEPVRCTVRFEASVRRYLEEHRFHESQRLAPQEDGTVLASFDLTAFEEFQAWVLSFGSRARVLEPAELRVRIAAEIQRLGEVYRDGESSANRTLPEAETEPAGRSAPKARRRRKRAASG